MNDLEALQKLIARMGGRVMHRRRGKQQCSGIVRRYPVDIAYRYLRRFVGGQWHRGGYHVARYNHGPGIGFPGWTNDAEFKTVTRFT